MNKINFNDCFWENVKIGNQNLVIDYRRNNFNTFGMYLLEREGDKEQLNKANKMYYEVLDNTEKYQKLKWKEVSLIT